MAAQRAGGTTGAAPVFAGVRWRGRLVALGVMVLAAVATTTAWATSSTEHAQAPVRLLLAHHKLRAGQSVEVAIVDRTSRQVLRSFCFELQLRVSHGWKTIARTHGVPVPCSLTTGGIPVTPHSVDHAPLIPYDDLQPGRYRITMAYKLLPKHWRVASLHHHRLVCAQLMVLRFRPGPAPRLPERRIRRIAVKAAAAGGDPHPALIQHAEGTRFAANLLAGGDLVYDWRWAYLIAIKGHFKFAVTGPPGTGSKPHRYSVITIILDAKRGRGEDLGLSNRYPDLAKLGPITTDYRHRPRHASLRREAQVSARQAPRTKAGAGNRP